MTDALQGKFDVIIAEALDRISRDQEDVAGIYKRLAFAGVKVVTQAEGEISELHVGLKGTMNALFLKDLAAKTRRGLRGRVEKGRSGGGLCYGYQVEKKHDANGDPIRGGREVVEAEAVVVRRIFSEFANGKSPRAIAKDLNAERIPGPRGRAWSDGAIRGHACRGNGILNNELYIGTLVWNRQSFIKNPETGKRIARHNPESEWVRVVVPELRIVSDELWQAVRASHDQIREKFASTIAGVRAARAKKIRSMHRPAFLLSGVLTCGCCGGKYGIVVDDRYGCLNRYRRGTCTNGRTIKRGAIEQRVLVGLNERLVSPETVEAAVRSYHEELNRLNRERRAQSDIDRQRLAKIDRSIRGIMTAIEDDMYRPEMKDRLAELEKEKAVIAARLESASADRLDVNPNIANLYRERVGQLTKALEDPQTNLEARDAIRSLVGEVILMPGSKRGEVHATLCGDLAAILAFAEQKKNSRGQNASGVITKMVAGTRNPRQCRWIPAVEL